MMIALWVFAGQAKAARYTNNLNGTITDNVTGLMWQQSDDDITRTWEQAISYCEALSLGGHSDWRLPNVKELQSIIAYGYYSPSINTTAFPWTKAYFYWSSTTAAFYTSRAWYVFFENGTVDDHFNKTNTFYVRCVR